MCVPSSAIGGTRWRKAAGSWSATRVKALRHWKSASTGWSGSGGKTPSYRVHLIAVFERFTLSPPAMYEDLSLYIDGQFLKGGGRREQDVFNPATDEVIGKLPHAGQADLDLALTGAQTTFQGWRKSSPLERSRILRKVAELTRARADEIGRTSPPTRGNRPAEPTGGGTAGPSM